MFAAAFKGAELTLDPDEVEHGREVAKVSSRASWPMATRSVTKSRSARRRRRSSGSRHSPAAAFDHGV
jgi:hypothetical protein